jgi:hypothetical protein
MPLPFLISQGVSSVAKKRHNAMRVYEEVVKSVQALAK